MPTYGYRCTACNAEFDVWQKMSDPAEATCPSCGAAARRMFFPAGIVFKGTGFYATDHQSSSGSSPAKSNGASKDGGSDAADKKAPASSGSTSTSSSSDTNS